MSDRRRRDVVISTRFSYEELSQLQTWADEAGMLVSVYLRQKALEQTYPPAEVHTYTCGHASIAGAFNEPPQFGCGCTLAADPDGPSAMLTALPESAYAAGAQPLCCCGVPGVICEIHALVGSPEEAIS